MNSSPVAVAAFGDDLVALLATDADWSELTMRRSGRLTKTMSTRNAKRSRSEACGGSTARSAIMK